MKTIEVTVSELRNGSTSLDSANQAFMEAANQMKAAAEELAGMWEGPTKERFVQGQDTIYKWYQEMSNVVAEYAKSMNEAANDYEATDLQAANAIRKH